jgi:hypothetical protein
MQEQGQYAQVNCKQIRKKRKIIEVAMLQSDEDILEFFEII